MTSSRRSCSKSTSMSGGSLRSFEMKRSNSSSIARRIDLGDAERNSTPPSWPPSRGPGRGCRASARSGRCRARSGRRARSRVRRSAPVRARSVCAPSAGAPRGQRQRDALLRSARAASSMACGLPAPVRADTGTAAGRGRNVQRSAMRSDFFEQFRRIDRRQRGARAQVALAVRKQALAPASPMVTRWRMAVSVSCNDASAAHVHVHVAAATSGRPSCFPSVVSDCRRASSSAPRCSSTASQARSPNRARSQRPSSGSGVLDGIHRASAPGKPSARSARVRR